MIKHPDQRVAVFIDTQNMYYSARNLFNARVNFKNILEDAVGGRRLVRAIAYVVSTKSGEERPFFDALGKVGIETKEKELQIYFGGAKKADWDVGIAVDAIKLADKVDAVILASGDGDFCPLLEYLKVTKGCLVEVMSFKETTSSKLYDIIDDHTNLSDNVRRYLLGPIEKNATRENASNEGRTREVRTLEGNPRERNSRQVKRVTKKSTEDIYPIMTAWGDGNHSHDNENEK